MFFSTIFSDSSKNMWPEQMQKETKVNVMVINENLKTFNKT